MPGLDGTGPMGQGSGSGRGLGKCNPAKYTNNKENIQRPMGAGLGRGFSRGCGRGFGGVGFRRNWNAAPMNAEGEGKKS